MFFPKTIVPILQKKYTSFFQVFYRNLFTTLINNKLINFIEEKKMNKLKLLKFLRKNLEEYKIPDDIIFMDKFPINKNGKIDYKKIVNIYEKKSS